MMDICVMNSAHEKWETVAEFAQNCSWKAGIKLAELMRSGAFRSWERVIAVFENGTPAGFCTLTEKDELDTKYPYCVFIGFVFVDESHRGHRLSEKMIRKAIGYAGSCGFKTVHIMSAEKGLYEKYGFEYIGDFETIYGNCEQLFGIAANHKAGGRL